MLLNLAVAAILVLPVLALVAAIINGHRPVTCPHCDKRTPAPYSARSERIRCRTCGTRMTVEAGGPIFRGRKILDWEDG